MSSFQFNNFGLALGMTLKFYTSVSNGLKLKVKKFSGLITPFVEVTREKLVWRAFLPSPLILNGVKSKCKWASNGSNFIWRWDEFTIKMVSKAMHI